MTHPFELSRRHLMRMAMASATLAASGFSASAVTENNLKLGRPAPFSFEALKARAAELAAKPYIPVAIVKPDILEAIDYDAHGRIRFKPEHALFANGPGPFPVTFFHLGRYFQKPVRMHVVADDQAREIIYDRDDFLMPDNSPAKALAENAGFAGFRIQEHRKGRMNAKNVPLDWKTNDWVAFLGASYFRAIGELYQYGISARAVAVDVAVDTPEEFPAFTHIYFETPDEDDAEVTLYALLDGPGMAGAYRFTSTRDAGVTMDIESSLILRRNVKRLGLAPLTSMYWFSETRKPTAVDWRPEVHDSDGLALWNGTGERIWRPLNNPSRTTVSAFMDSNPKGFGLLQRDRLVDHYLDGVAYERRPSVWVETIGAWGKGSVQLVEIPTDDEIHDNIVAMWVPAEEAKAGQKYDLHYRLYWKDEEPFAPTLARCVATRLGNGGQPGQARPKGVRKFMIEFLGDALKSVPFGAKPDVVVTPSRGNVSRLSCEAVPDDVAGHWRAHFDLAVTGTEPVDLRCFLKQGDQVLSETWLYQYEPF